MGGTLALVVVRNALFRPACESPVCAIESNTSARLLALLNEAEARGHLVRVPKRNVHGYLQNAARLGGDIIVQVGEIQCSVNIWQPKDRVPHVSTREEVESARKYSWPPPKYDYVPAARLSVTIDTDSGFSPKISWPETKTLRLEARLPDVMTTFERWATIDAERKEAERRAEIEAQERREREDGLVRHAYVQHALGERLVADLNAWELTPRLRHYLAGMAEGIQHITDDDKRLAAVEWLEWCHRYAASGECVDASTTQLPLW